MSTEDVSADVWTQDGPVGASDSGFPEPSVMPAVAIAGLVQVRDTPSLMAITGTIPGLGEATTVHLIGASPQRRRVLISASVDIAVNTDRGAAQQGYGLRIPANGAPVELRAAVDIYVHVLGESGDVTFWAEVDPG